MNITICGGGNLGHVCAGYLSTNKEQQVSLLTTQPDSWSHHLEVTDPNGVVFQGRLHTISSNPAEVIPNADIVLICLPGYAIHNTLLQIAPYLRTETWVGSIVASTGFFFDAMEVLPKNQILFGFQRVPFISRIIKYGHSAQLKGYKESLCLAVEQTDDKEKVRSVMRQLFNTPTKLLESYYEASLSNSNPLLHTARLYTMWKDWEPGMIYDHNPFFYADWTEEASELLIEMDKEFQMLLSVIGLKNGNIPTVLDYYESYDAESLTKKIRSISAFQGILSPMKQVQEGWIPDFSSRYFTEDYPYGLRLIANLAKEKSLVCPNINQVYEWGMDKI